MKDEVDGIDAQRNVGYRARYDEIDRVGTEKGGHIDLRRECI